MEYIVLRRKRLRLRLRCKCGYFTRPFDDDLVRSMNEYLQLDPDSLQMWRFKATCELDLGRYNDAIASMNEVLARDPNDTGSIVMKADALLKAGRVLEAWDLYWSVATPRSGRSPRGVVRDAFEGIQQICRETRYRRWGSGSGRVKTCSFDYKNLSPISDTFGYGKVPKDFQTLLEQGEAFLSKFAWCPQIVRRYFGCGERGRFAVFLFEFDRKIGDIDARLWVVVSAAPPAYVVTDRADIPGTALVIYCDLLESWCAAIKSDSPRDDVFPFGAPPSLALADFFEFTAHEIRRSTAACT